MSSCAPSLVAANKSCTDRSDDAVGGTDRSDDAVGDRSNNGHLIRWRQETMPCLRALLRPSVNTNYSVNVSAAGVETTYASDIRRAKVCSVKEIVDGLVVEVEIVVIGDDGPNYCLTFTSSPHVNQGALVNATQPARPGTLLLSNAVSRWLMDKENRDRLNNTMLPICINRSVRAAHLCVEVEDGPGNYGEPAFVTATVNYDRKVDTSNSFKLSAVVTSCNSSPLNSDLVMWTNLPDGGLRALNFARIWWHMFSTN